MSIRRRHAIGKAVKRNRRTQRPWPALVGDGSGTIEVPGSPGMWYVRPTGSDLAIPVYKGAAQRIEGYPVWVGQDVYNRRWLRILGTNLEALSGGGGVTPSDVEPHASTHYLVNGSDPVYITTRQVTDLLLTVVSGMTVRINGGFVIVGGQPAYVTSQNIDLTSNIPGSGALWGIIRANASGVLSVQEGAGVDSFADLTVGNIPAVADDYAALWAVRLYDGQTAVNGSVTGADYYDLRFAPMDAGGGGGTLADHDHSGDAGDGGTFDAANLTSGAATNDFVLTADGSGGAAWEAIPTPPSALDDLTDVDTTDTATGDVIYNSGSGWVDYPLGIGSKITVSGNDLRFGNVSGGNYINIDASTGNLRLNGDATQWDDLRIAGSAVRLGATSPTLAAFGPSGSIRCLRFDNGQHDEIYFEIQMPHAWKEGSNIYPHVHWSPVTTEAGNVVWQFDYIWADIGEAFGAPTTMTSAAEAAGGKAWVHKLSVLKDGSANAYIDGTGKTLSSMLVCRLHRDAGAGSDTLTEDVAFLEFDIHYEVDSFGSDEEYIKDATAALLLESGDYLLLENGDNLLLE